MKRFIKQIAFTLAAAIVLSASFAVPVSVKAAPMPPPAPVIPVDAVSPTGYFVVGYITGYNVANGDLPYIEMSHLTHIIWQGVKVTSSSNAALVSYTGDPISQLTSVRAAANAVGVKTLVSLIGSWGNGDMLAVVNNNSLRANLVSNVVTLINTYSLDGVEIDWEAYPGQAAYNLLITDLYAALNPLGKIIVPVGNWDAFDFSVSVVTNKVAFVNVMAYDMYRPHYYPYHALYDDAIAVMANWVTNGYPKAKLVMGIPDYGRDYDDMWVSYRSIVDTLHPTDGQDSATISTFNGQTVTGGVLWWGGPTLAERKVQWVKDNSYGGVFIYELGTDKFNDDRSLFRHIYRKLEEGGSPPPAPTLSSIAVTPSTLIDLAIGGTHQYTATGTYSDSTQVGLTSNVTWVSSNTSVATISSTGLATGIAAGTVNITSNLTGVTSPAVSLTVVNTAPLTLTSISVTPATPADKNVSDTLQFVATGTYSDNSSATLTSNVTWNSSNTAVATISAGGLVTCLSVGTTSITSTKSSLTSAARTMTVVAPSGPAPAPPPAPPAAPQPPADSMPPPADGGLAGIAIIIAFFMAGGGAAVASGKRR